MTDMQTGFGMLPMSSEVRAKWGWFVSLGVALLIVGILALGNLLIATVASVLFVGIMMIVGAAAYILHSFQVKRWSGFFFWLFSGVLYLVAGIITFNNPALAAATFTLLLAIVLMASGILRIWTSVQLRPQSGWGWVTVSGVITLIAGIVFLLGWPVNSMWLLGLVLAIDLIFQGITAIAFGLALRVVH